MGGATVTRSGNNKRKILKELREQIRRAFPTLQADSSLVVLNTKNPEEHEIYDVVYCGIQGKCIMFMKSDVPNRVGLPVTVAKLYHKLQGTWLATVHLS